MGWSLRRCLLLGLLCSTGCALQEAPIRLRFPTAREVTLTLAPRSVCGGTELYPLGPAGRMWQYRSVDSGMQWRDLVVPLDESLELPEPGEHLVMRRTSIRFGDSKPFADGFDQVLRIRPDGVALVAERFGAKLTTYGPAELVAPLPLCSDIAADIVTPAGRFHDCPTLSYEAGWGAPGLIEVTVVCPGVGVVAQLLGATEDPASWELFSYLERYTAP